MLPIFPHSLRASASFLFLLTAAAQAEPKAHYVRKGTWHETLLASREALMKQEADSGQQSTGTDSVQLGPWHSIGPFPRRGKGTFEHEYGPEKEIDLEKNYENGKLRWRPRPAWADGSIHALNGSGNVATYLFRTLTAKKAVTLTGYFGSDDYLTVWLNGKALLSVKEPRGVTPNQDTAKLVLQAGENQLLLKITNQGGGFGFYFSTEAKPKGNRQQNSLRAGLWKLLLRDFRDGQSIYQMGIERKDQLWKRDWPPGDVKVLAGRYAQRVRNAEKSKQAKALAAKAETHEDLKAVREIYYRAHKQDDAVDLVRNFDFQALRRAIQDLTRTFGARYPKGSEYLARSMALEKEVQRAVEGLAKNKAGTADSLLKTGESLDELRYQALLANPLLDFEKLLLVRRGATRLGLPQNWQGNCAISKTGYDNEIAVLSPVRPGGELTTLFKPDGDRFVGDVDLHFDADRMLFSMPGSHGRWQIFEMKIDGTGLRQLTPTDQRDFDNYDPCYLPSGKIMYGSTACFQGVPCVGGGNTVANMYLMDAAGGKIRRLTFDQDHDWCPTVLNDGRVLYSRWEYSDSAHYFTRLLFRMNPDGTGQAEYYGSNSLWPNAVFYARPIPGHPTQVAGIVSGHHGVPRMGELVIFDPAKGRHEADGVVQRIPGYGKKVEPVIRDALVNRSWPRFLHPYPLSEKYFLVSCQPDASSPWGIYLVDVFDNLLPIHQEDGYAMLEPVPLRKTRRPPVIPDKVNLDRKDAVVHMADVYRGNGLKGVPRGTVKKLRVYEIHYAYPRMGGHINIGIDGPWDVHRIHGTVPVEKDGSAMFRVPANTPLAVQPLDSEGKALQVMRSWFTAMPGENLSCVGCHESQNTAAPTTRSLASAKRPSDISPWYGPPRGFSFSREVQPVLDKHCIGCHNGAEGDGKALPDLRAKEKKGWHGFTQSYIALHPYVRRPGPESDYHMQPPLEFHAGTSELIQLLEKGHHNVQLDAEARDRLVTWIDLNVPDHGTWSEHRKIASDYQKRRQELRMLYANVETGLETVPTTESEVTRSIRQQPTKQKVRQVECPGWPFDAAEAKKRQAAAGQPDLSFDLADSIKMEFSLIPPGEFVMGDADGHGDEHPLSRVAIKQPFYMGKFEVTNEQFAQFDPSHDSRYISVFNKDQSTRGVPANRPQQPVIRVSWQRAIAFCRWLSQKIGREVSLPTEAQWEYACRAGTATPLHYGETDTDFGKLANMADQHVNNLCRRGSPRWIPSIGSVNDGAVIGENGGRYLANAWGLHDMHGNVFEWTRNAYKPYPYRADDGRENAAPSGRKVVRGGSWYDRPKRCRSAFRLSYPSWQVVFNVGFRVVCSVSSPSASSAEIRR